MADAVADTVDAPDVDAKPKSRRGGARFGTGPKPPARELLKRHLAALTEVRRTVHAGLLPLEVMLYRMRGITMPDGTLVSDDMMSAAIAAAPYIHPRLQAIAIRPGDAALTEDQRREQQTTRSILLAELALLARPEPLTVDQTEPQPDAASGAPLRAVGVPPPKEWE